MIGGEIVVVVVGGDGDEEDDVIGAIAFNEFTDSGGATVSLLTSSVRP